ncbi:RagB/SusD family nutrient uptake outer membrane protein [Compostibacter hankyongensis]|uniref:RagB/SusD family nutrient uptake outer membrane protein n=1 Tax=Compostibacter hankyongensis TaxID=1007089 RepID=A0ABP8FIR5_9BACT
MKKSMIITGWVVLSVVLTACDKYLDVVPDNVATIDYAFRTRSTAEKFLFTCYSYMPHYGAPEGSGGNPGFVAGDEIWLTPNNASNAWQIARGNQKVVQPYTDFWRGGNGGIDLYQGIRDCNIFLENIDMVPDMEEFEKNRWIAEVKFLKAYYHFWLLRMYGPIPLIRENLPVDADREAVQLFREPVDTCVAYIVRLLDEAAADLPDRIENEVAELGRITKAIDLSLKAEVLVTAASPLFNGNADYTGFAGPDGKPLFDAAPDPGKWQVAAKACREAVELCESLGYKLYYYQPQFSQYDLSDTTLTEMSIRNAVCEKWNAEVIWGDINSTSNTIQARSTPRGLDPDRSDNQSTLSNLAPPLKIVEQFYSNHGVPITEDKTWDYEKRFDLVTPGTESRYDLKPGYTTASLNYNREPRFYADLGFDGGIWYGQGRFDDKSNDLLFVSAKRGQPASVINPNNYSVTGYWPKKLVNFQNVIGSGNTYTVQDYPWPIMRLAGLYLLYAEAQNEASGPGQEVFRYIDAVRERAGLPTVEDAWTNYSTSPGKYTTKEGMREIIRRERLIELAFEGQRYWDLRRWKEAAKTLNQPITGWDTNQEDAASYYRETVLYNQQFTTRDYLWPIGEDEVISNKNLVQNPGW